MCLRDNFTMDWHPIQGEYWGRGGGGREGGAVVILLVASCYGNRDTLRLKAPLYSSGDVTNSNCFLATVSFPLQS